MKVNLLKLLLLSILVLFTSPIMIANAEEDVDVNDEQADETEEVVTESEQDDETVINEDEETDSEEVVDETEELESTSENSTDFVNTQSVPTDLTNSVNVDLVTFEHYSGDPVEDGDRVSILSRFYVQYSIDMLENVSPSEGDTIQVTFPSPMQSVQGSSFEIPNQNGDVIGTFTIEAGSNVGTVTFNSFYDNSDNVITGPLQIRYLVELDRSQITSEIRIPIQLRDSVIFIIAVPPGNTPDSILAKWNGSGYQVVETETGDIYTQWGIRVNRSKSVLHNAVLTDDFKGGQKLDVGFGLRLQRFELDGSQTSLRLGMDEFSEIVTYRYENPSDPTAVTGYTMNFPSPMVNMYEVHYRTIITDGGASKEYSNVATFNADEIREYKDERTAVNESGEGEIVDNPGDGTGETPGDGTGETPGEGTGETPGETPGDSTGETPGDGTGETPGEGTGETPGDGTGETPGDGTSETPDEGTGETPGDGTSETPGDGTGETPGEGTGETPDDGTSETPDEGTGETPDDGTSETPDEGIGETPGESPTSDPKTDKGTVDSPMLPETGINQSNLLIGLGIVLLVVGLGFLFFRRKKTA